MLSIQKSNGNENWRTCQSCGQRWEAILSERQVEIAMQKTKEGSVNLLESMTPMNTIRQMSASSTMSAPGAFQWCHQAYRTLLTLGMSQEYAVRAMMDTKYLPVDKEEIHAFIRALATKEATAPSNNVNSELCKRFLQPMQRPHIL